MNMAFVDFIYFEITVLFNFIDIKPFSLQIFFHRCCFTAKYMRSFRLFWFFIAKIDDNEVWKVSRFSWLLLWLKEDNV